MIDQNGTKKVNGYSPLSSDRIVFRFLAIGLMAMVASTVCCGCGEEKKPKRKRPAPVARPQSTPTVDEAEAKAPKVEAKKEPERPENIVDWRKDDYYSAKKDEDKRLTEAVVHLGKKFAGKPSAARLLANLLTVDVPDKEDEKEADGTEDKTRRRMNTRRQRKLVRLSAEQIKAIITALGINGTDESRAILEEILSDKLKTDDDRTAVTQTLTMLVAVPSPANESILFKTLVDPEKYRPLGQKAQKADRNRRSQARATMTADQLRSEVRKIVEPVASSEFRVKLAEYLLAPTTPLEKISKLRDFIEKKEPINLAAQIVLYESPELDNKTKAELEKFFSTYATNALGHALGLLTRPKEKAASRWMRHSGRDNRHGKSNKTERVPTVWSDSNPKLPYLEARLLWNPKLATAIVKQLDKIDSLHERLTLARTLPVDRLRAALYTMLMERWKDGPKDLQLSDKITDPGFLIVMKMMPRKHPEKKKTITRTKTRAKQGRAIPQKQATSTSDQVEEEWMKASESFIKSLCKQFEKVAEPKTEDVQKVAKLPFELHKNAQVVATYSVDWPGGLKNKLTGLVPDPLVVHYIRIEGEGRFTRVLNHYRKGTKKSNVLETKKEAWIDRLQIGSKPDLKRSIDVLIKRVGEPPNRPTDPEELVIEILSIETKSPVSQTKDGNRSQLPPTQQNKATDGTRIKHG